MSGLKTILFLDKDPTFLRRVDIMKDMWAKMDCEVHCVWTVDSAFEILSAKKVDLISISTLALDDDRFEFLLKLKRDYPKTHVTVTVRKLSTQVQGEYLSHGVELVQEKPVSLEDMHPFFNTLCTTASQTAGEGFRGVMASIGMADIIQLECLRAGSSILEIKDAGETGQIFIEQGRIVHACVGRLSGATAFNHLLAMNGGQFNQRPFQEPSEKTICESWEFLILEAAKSNDELKEANTLAAAQTSHSEKKVALEFDADVNPDDIVLLINATSGPFRAIKLHPGINSLGSSENNDICVKHESISSHHCFLILDEGKVGLQDLESVNGITINDEKVVQEFVEIGDEFFIGQASSRIYSAHMLRPTEEAGDCIPAPVEEAPTSIPEETDETYPVCCISTDLYADIQCLQCTRHFANKNAKITNSLDGPRKYFCPECGSDCIPLYEDPEKPRFSLKGSVTRSYQKFLNAVYQEQ